MDGDVDLFLAEDVRVTRDWSTDPTDIAMLSFHERQSDGSLLQRNVSAALQPLDFLFGSLDLADWDGDGKADILGCQRRGDGLNALVWVAHDGSSTATLLEFGLDEDACAVPEAVDWDGDGDMDLFLGTRKGTVRFFERFSPALGALRERHGADHPLGGMSFADGASYFAPFASPEAADWDGDGDLDLFVASPGAVEFFERRQDGRLLQVTYSHMVADIPTHINQLKMVDWDGDGDLDVFLNDRTQMLREDGGFQIKLRSTSWRFMEVVAEEQPFAGLQGSGFTCARLADWDGDGIVDVLLGNDNGNLVAHRRLYDGSYVLWQQLVNVAAPCEGQLFDWDASGTLDLVTYDQGCVVWQPGLPGRTFGPPMTILCLTNSAGIFDCHGQITTADATFWGWDVSIVEIMDWNADGVHDIVFSSGCVAIMHGTAPANDTFKWGQLPYNMTGFVQAVDVDGDGDYDLVHLNIGDAYNISVYDRKPDNSLVFKETLPLVNQESPDNWMVTRGFDMKDVDGDGNPDVFISCAWLYDGEAVQGVEPMLTMRYWTSGCLDRRACSGHGTCGPTSSRCSCADGYDDKIGDCSRCAADYHTVVDALTAPVMESRVCAPCAGASALGWCHGRGICQDDAAAVAAASNLSKPLVRGSGTCVCRDAAFGGADCGEGQCPVWRAEGTGGACTLSAMYFGMALAFGLLSLGAWLLMPMLLSTPLVVQEVSGEDSRVIVTVGRPHHLLGHPVASARVRFWNTGHPALDKADQPFRVRVLDRDRFLLLDHRGVALNSRVDSSMGFVQVDRLRAAWCFGVAGVPVAVITMSLVGGALLAAWQGKLGMRTPFALVVATGVVAAIVVAWSSRSVTPLGRKLDDFGRLLAKGNPNPQPCDSAPGRALRAEQLWDLLESFDDFIRDRTSYYVSENIVKPLTRKRNLSYAELAGPSQVTWFVSHYWGMATRLLAESIKGHAVLSASRTGGEWQQVTYWVCTFSNNQWKVKEEIGEDCESSSFYSALCSADCRGTAMVLDEHAHPLSRAWCLFEVFLTCQLSSQRAGFEGLQLCTPSGVLGGGGAVDIAIAVARRLAVLDLEQARATEPADEVMIKQKVREMAGGFPAVNRFVRENIRRCLSNVQQAFETSLSEVVAQLGEPGTPSGAAARAAAAAAPLPQWPTLLVRRAATAPELACGPRSPSLLVSSAPEGDGRDAGSHAG